jgi:hypothetical protein
MSDQYIFREEREHRRCSETALSAMAALRQKRPQEFMRRMPWFMRAISVLMGGGISSDIASGDGGQLGERWDELQLGDFVGGRRSA